MSTETAATDDELQTKLAEQRKRRREEEHNRREEWRQVLSSQLEDLRNNRFHAPNLDALARVYLGMTEAADEDASARQRISDFIGGDDALVDAAMTAIREAVLRDDVPSVEETVDLHADSKRSWLAYPVLASLHMLHVSDPDRLDAISDDRKREALAILYCVSPHNGSADWLEQWFRQKPELVLDVLRQCATPAVRSGEEFVPCIDLLNGFGGPRGSVRAWVSNERTGLFETRSPKPRFDRHDDLIHATRLRLLEAVPVRGPNKQLQLVDSLLAETMQHRDPAALREITRKKLSSTSMNIGQRIRWLTVDAFTSPDPDLRELKQQVCVQKNELRVQKNELRVRHFADFLNRTARQDDMRKSVLSDVCNPNALGDVIEILAPWFPPVRWGASGFITLGMEISELLEALITQLGTLAGREADRAFQSLISDPLLERWHDYLKLAHEHQRVASRDASYSHPSLEFSSAEHNIKRSETENA